MAFPRVYTYTGPDFTTESGREIKSGDSGTLVEIANWAGMTIAKFSYYLRKPNSNQTMLNHLINPAVPFGPKCKEEVIYEVRRPDWTDLKADLLAGISTTDAMKKYGSSSMTIAKFKRELGLIKGREDKLEKEHICKCPTCGKFYKRKGFYTGRGTWRKKHDPGKCPGASGGTGFYSQRNIYSVGVGI